MQERSDEGDFLPPWELSEGVFEDAPQMHERYEELPERVRVKKSVAHAANRSHRIRTDTGIELSRFQE